MILLGLGSVLGIVSVLALVGGGPQWVSGSAGGSVEPLVSVVYVVNFCVFVHLSARRLAAIAYC